LANFKISKDRKKVDSEQVILERSIDLLFAGGRLGLVLPDGLLNNQGEISNCPATRRLLARQGYIEAIISLPDYAFRKSGAQNKTSILFFRKFTEQERNAFDRAFAPAVESESDESNAVAVAIVEGGLNYKVFLAEANHVGYTPAGQPSRVNDLYHSNDLEPLAKMQEDSILGEWRRFKVDPNAYDGRLLPDCMAVPFDVLWKAHSSNRLDPKYHLFEREKSRPIPQGWITLPLRSVMRRRLIELDRTTTNPDEEFRVMTISQTGDIREREAGKGRNPPKWLGTYFIDSPGTWFAALANDVVYSSIDLWKGCIAVVPEQFNNALVSKEFPIYEVTDSRLLPEFLQCLLRTRYYQRAFRAITTGHSNRRRTQEADFEALPISFPGTLDEQRRLISPIQSARVHVRDSGDRLKRETLILSDIIDGRGEEELPEIPLDSSDNGSLPDEQT
jgi:type I restriction enzyme M protein